jgi:two component transcriptional regulator
MVNVLIIEDNIHYAIFMMNYLCQHNPDIRICNIISDGKEAINVLNRQKNIDIVLLDLNLPNYNGGEILEKIVNKEKYTDSIIVLSGEIDCLKKLYKNNLIYDILYKSTDMKRIIRSIDSIVSNKNAFNIKKQITQELLYLNYDISNKGTLYLVDTIKYVILNMPNKEFNNLISEVYPIIAKQNNDTVHNIKSNIIRANDKMYKQCEISKLLNYFNFCEDRKPDIRTVVRTIISKIT